MVQNKKNISFYNLDMNSIKNQNGNPKESLNKFIEKTGNSIRFANHYKDYIKYKIKTSPLPIKIANIAVPMALTYVFTMMYYNLPASIFFAIITFLSILILSLPMAIIFLILYIIIISTRTTSINSVLGVPILETNIIKNKEPFNCTAKSLTVQSNILPQNLDGGYFTYSFWLYLNGNNNNINNNDNWYSYRYKEWKSIFYRGIPMQNDLSTLTQFPGFWLTPVINSMVIVFQNGSTIERIELIGIPFNEWVNYAIVVETQSVSIYINGLLDRTVSLSQSILNMNENSLYISNDKSISLNKKQSGFAGSIAQLIYYNYSLSQFDIHNSYNYYKKIIDKYQNDKISKYKYSVSNLITNSDILK
jgi:hypothetical protein